MTTTPRTFRELEQPKAAQPGQDAAPLPPGRDVVLSDGSRPTDAQVRTFRELEAKGALDTRAMPGSQQYPTALQSPTDVLSADRGAYYVDQQGQMGRTAPLTPDEIQGEFVMGGADLSSPEAFASSWAKQYEPYARDPSRALADARVSLGFFLTPDQRARVDIIRKAYPGAEFGYDEEGNVAVRPSPEEPWRYLNRKGLSATDAYDFGSQAGQFAALGGIGKGATLGTRALVQGGVGAGLTLAQDGAAQGLGSEQGFDGGRAAMNALGGAGGEYVGAAIASTGRAAGQGVVDTVRAITPQPVREQIVQAVPAMQDVGRAFSRRAADATGAPADPGAIPMTRGQISGNFNQIAFEQAALRGARGEEAQQVMSGFAEEQARAALGVGRQLGGAAPGVNQFDAAGAVQTTLRGAEQAAKARVGDAYEAVRQSPALVNGPAVNALPARIDAALNDNLFSADVLSGLQPRTQAIYRQIVGLAKTAPTVPGPGGKQVADASMGLPIGGIERVRQLINDGLRTTQGQDQAALQVMKREFDNWLDDAVDNGLLRGDEKDLALLRQARTLHREYRRVYGGGRGAKTEGQRLMQKLIGEGANEVDAANLLFGRAEVSGTGGPVELVRHIGTATGRKGDAWNNLRAGVVLRMMEPLERGLERGPTAVNYDAVITRWNEALNGRGRPLMRELFTDQELGRMQAFLRQIRRIQPPEGSVNRSGTGYEGARAIQQAFGVFTNSIPGLNVGVKAVQDAQTAGRARAAVEPLFVNRLPGAAAAGAVAAGSLTSEPYRIPEGEEYY